MLKRFSAAKKTKSSQNRFRKWRFFGNLRVCILIVVIGNTKRHILGRNDVFWRIFRNNPFRGVGSSELQEPKNALKRHQMLRKITYMGTKNPWREGDKIWRSEWRPRHCHPRQFWWRSIKGFWRGEGSNFGLFHWLASSPLKHSRTTVRVCDIRLLKSHVSNRTIHNKGPSSGMTVWNSHGVGVYRSTVVRCCAIILLSFPHRDSNPDFMQSEMKVEYVNTRPPSPPSLMLHFLESCWRSLLLEEARFLA